MTDIAPANSDVSNPNVDDRAARRNVIVLILAQAILGAQMPMIFAVGGLAGQMLAPNPCLATLPISLIVFGSIFGLLALAPLIWAGWREVVSAVEGGSYFFGDLNLPKWPGRVIFLVGISFAWLRLAVMVWHDIGALRRGAALADTGHGG